MATRATRSASRKARRAETVATGPLGALSHDELGVIVDGLADPLQPVVAVALSSTCLGLRTPLQAALEVLKERHGRAKALCRKLVMGVSWSSDSRGAPMSCAELANARYLTGSNLAADGMATLGMILRTNGLPRLKELSLQPRTPRTAAQRVSAGFGDAGVQALCQDLGRGAAPSLDRLDLAFNKIGPAGAVALAAAFRRGAMPKLQELWHNDNPIGNQGVAALAAPLRKMPALRTLALDCCEFGDEGVASLFANLGKAEFKKLGSIVLDVNEVTDEGCATLVSAIDSHALPMIGKVHLLQNPASDAAKKSVCDAVDRANIRFGWG